MLRRVLAFVLAVTLALLPSTAYADEVDPFVEQIYLTVTDGSNGQQQKYVKLVKNLAGLWYGTVQNGTTTKRQPVVTTGLLGRSLDAFLQQANGDGELAYKWFMLNMQYMDWAVNWQIVDYDADPTANLNMYSTDLMSNYQDWYSYLTGWEPSQGGGGETLTGFPSTFTLTTIYAGSWATPDSNSYKSTGYIGSSDSKTLVNWGTEQGNTPVPSGPSTITCNLSQNMVDSINSKLESLDDSNMCVLAVLGGGSGVSQINAYNNYDLRIFIVDRNQLTLGDNTALSNYGYTIGSGTFYQSNANSSSGFFNKTIVNNTVTVNVQYTNFSTKTSSGNVGTRGNHPPYAYYLYNGGTTTDPTNPTPVIPTPPLQVEPEVEPYPEKPTNPTPTITAPLTIQNESTTTTTDLTPILQAIRILNSNVIEGIETIHSDITQCCETMRTFLDEWANYFGDMLEQIGDRIKGMWYEVTKELIESNSWLEGIYYKLGANGSRPDISNTEEYNNWFNWLIDKALGLLPSDGPAADLVNLFSSLVNVFPFCVPHDLGVILGLFSQSPVTPVVDLPMPTFSMSSGWTTVPVRVDCTPWNDLMGLVRRTQEIVFAFALAMWTRNGLKHFEVDVW